MELCDSVLIVPEWVFWFLQYIYENFHLYLLLSDPWEKAGEMFER